MSIYDGNFPLFLKHKASLAPTRAEAHALCVGHADFLVTPAVAARSEVAGYFLPPSRFLFEDRWLRDDFWGVVGQLSHRLCGLFFQTLGYARYSTLDLMREGADVRLDLNQPLPPEYAGQFDLVWDNSTIEHTLNVGQAFLNLMNLTRPGGKLVMHQAIGDQNNGGYWTISPDAIKDFLETNGFRVDVMDCFNQQGRSFPYGVFHTAFTPVASIIPVRYLPGTLLRRFRCELRARLLLRFPSLARRLQAPLDAARRATARGERRRARAFAACQRLVDVLFGLNLSDWIGGPIWTLFCVATKLRDTPASHPIQAIYRKQAA